MRSVIQMSAQDASESISADDFADECPHCGADLSIDQRTEIETLHTARKAYTYDAHMSEEHPVIWWVAGKIAWVKRKLRQLKA